MITVRWEVQAETVFLRPEEEALLRMEARMWAHQMTMSTMGLSTTTVASARVTLRLNGGSPQRG